MSKTMWRPQSRPQWVAAMNKVGAVLGATVLVPLDEESLLDAARTATGLDDFGPDQSWREPFGTLVADIAFTSNLTLTGRVLARFDLVRALATLLRLADAEKRHPEILEQSIEAPIFITGMGRTGTSILHEVIGQDAQLRAPCGFEWRYPSSAADRQRPIEDVQAEIDLWLAIVPEFAPIHEMAADGPDEDSVGQALGFASQVWSATHRAPNFDMWMMMSGWPAAFRFQGRLLQHLQWQQPPKRWLLKGIYLAGLPHLFAEFPDARIINTHRDPLNVMASTANMLATLRWQRSDVVDYDEIAAPIALGVPIMMDMLVDQRRGGTVPDDRFVDVRFADLMADPLAAIRGVYDRLGLELTNEASRRMQDYLDAKPRGRHGAPNYRFADLGLDEAEMRRRFSNYMRHFDIPKEKV